MDPLELFRKGSTLSFSFNLDAILDPLVAEVTQGSWMWLLYLLHSISQLPAHPIRLVIQSSLTHSLLSEKDFNALESLFQASMFDLVTNEQ